LKTNLVELWVAFPQPLQNAIFSWKATAGKLENVDYCAALRARATNG
jgi:hypothetical protein